MIAGVIVQWAKVNNRHSLTYDGWMQPHISTRTKGGSPCETEGNPLPAICPSLHTSLTDTPTNKLRWKKIPLIMKTEAL